MNTETKAPIIPCDRCGHRESTWTCTHCHGLFCADCVLFVNATDVHPMGQVLCLPCYPEHHAQGRAVNLNERRFGRART